MCSLCAWRYFVPNLRFAFPSVVFMYSCIALSARSAARWRDSWSTVNWACSLMAALACIACVLSAGSAEKPKHDVTELAIAIEQIDKALEERLKTSVSYRLFGHLDSTDFGSSSLSWSHPGHLSSSPFSVKLRSLLFHAVCRRNETALKKLYEVNKLIYGGVFFDELQTHYLQKVVDRLSLKLNFVDQHREIYRAPKTDLRSINRKRRLEAAMDENQPQEALRLLTNFARLCEHTKDR